MNLHIPEAVSQKLARQALVLGKNSPSIFFAVGVVGSIASTALACRATLKLESVLDKANDDLETAQMIHKIKPEEYPAEEVAQVAQAIRVRTIFEIAELYAPAIGVGALAISALAYSHDALSRRNAALGAAYAILDQSFREYRQRVVENYGEEKDRELRFGTEKVSITDPETGRKKNVHRVGDGQPSGYARFFDQFNKEWDENPEYNLIYLRNQQHYLNDLLHARGHVFLNEAYEALGIPHSQAGAMVGWVVGGDMSDNYIDFGIFNGENRDVVDFVNGREAAILLDFNVDGVIYDKIEDQGAIGWQS